VPLHAVPTQLGVPINAMPTQVGMPIHAMPTQLAVSQPPTPSSESGSGRVAPPPPPVPVVRNPDEVAMASAAATQQRPIAPQGKGAPDPLADDAPGSAPAAPPGSTFAPPIRYTRNNAGRPVEAPVPLDSQATVAMAVPPQPPSSGQIARPGALNDPPTELTALGETISWPDSILRALSFVEAELDTREAMAAYIRAKGELQKSPWADDSRFDVLYLRARIELLLGEGEEFRELIGRLIAAHGAHHGGEILAILGRGIERFHVLEAPLRRERARLNEMQGSLEVACEDIEHAAKIDYSESDTLTLERLYRARIAATDEPAAKFKLVKVYLKSNRVDEAVEILQELQHNTSYETRAIKILGLCHWQKNLHFLAWQKFKQLPNTEEIRDILYRLANDMESTGQLNNALTVYEHIAQEDGQYRDVQSKMKKLRYRIKMQQEESAHGASPEASLNDPRFEIIEEINRGSMGIIFKARDKTLDEVVALKVLNDYLVSDPTAIERFKREARAAKKLSHPYIVRIHDMFENGNKRFISMEYIEGTDLKRMLAERGRFSEDQLVYYMLQIADALSYAHKLHIIHRDIKPANVMITRENSVKVTDFGIAKILKADEATKSGTAVIGTPLYMAPEQITGEGVDARSDIYSLGIMMYELISGHPPFYLGNIEYHHIHTAPPPLPDSVSDRLRSVIMKCVQKDPAARYQSVDQVFDELKFHGT
jgi:tRNA A-37 threonylcarbamoyl transferase component Bud32